MGNGLTSHHKRGNNYDKNVNMSYPFVNFHNYNNHTHTHVSKKQKIESLMDNNSTSISSNSTFNRYPDHPTPPSRWIVNRFSGFFSRIKGVGNEGSFDKLGENRDSFGVGLAGIVGLSDERGNELLLRYERTRKCAVDSILDRHCRKDEKGRSCKEVIDLDNDGYSVDGNEVEIVGSASKVIDLDKDGDSDDDEVEKVGSSSKVIDLDKGSDSDDDEVEKVGSSSKAIDLDKDGDEVEIVEKGSMVTEMDNVGKISNYVIDLDEVGDSDDDEEVEKIGFAREVNDLDKEDNSNDDEVEIVEKWNMATELEDAGRILETLLLSSDEDSVVQLSVDKNLLRELFLPLTDEEKDEVSQAFSENNWNKVLVTHENSNIDITGGVLQCLRPEEWLNDEVINVYFHLLKEREDREPDKFLKCHFFNTFFYKKLISGKRGYDYKSVRRWTAHKKLGYNLSECDKIFVPIHQRAHWCLAVINRKDKKFQYLDSLRGIDTNVLRVLAMYYADELKDKNGVDIDVLSWTQEHVENIPVQKNGSDCGMFIIKYADFYSRGLGLYFNQEHMPYFRLRTAKEILRLEAN